MSRVADRIEAVISDFGGVLTSPLANSFAALQEELGIPRHSLREALARIAEREGAHPLFELECGRVSEPDFLARLAEQLSVDLGRDVHMHEFTERYWARLYPNAPMIAFLAEVRRTGYRTALLTNNVREWEHRWRRMFPVDELFEVVVDSAFVGMRKPDPRIYTLTLERLGVEPSQAVFIDDMEVNCVAAREVGMVAVQFHDAEQAIAEVRAALRPPT
jgi:putative hydrolase of the HAD superfamily